MTFMELLLSAKLGSTSAFEELFARYKNLLRKYSVVNGIFDEDLYLSLIHISEPTRRS